MSIHTAIAHALEDRREKNFTVISFSVLKVVWQTYQTADVPGRDEKLTLQLKYISYIQVSVTL